MADGLMAAKATCLPKVVRDPADVFLESWRVWSIRVPADKHLNHFGNLQNNEEN